MPGDSQWEGNFILADSAYVIEAMFFLQFNSDDIHVVSTVLQ